MELVEIVSQKNPFHLPIKRIIIKPEKKFAIRRKKK